MEKEFVPYEIALKLKELGFDEPCLIYYLDDVNNTLIPVRPYHDKCESDSYPTNKDLMENWASAPTFSQTFRWFREKHGIWVTFEYDDCDCIEANICWYVGKCFIYGTGPLFLTNELGDFRTYEEAELACLNKLIEIVKSKSK